MVFDNAKTVTQSGDNLTVGDSSGATAILDNSSTGTRNIADNSGIERRIARCERFDLHLERDGAAAGGPLEVADRIIVNAEQHRQAGLTQDLGFVMIRRLRQPPRAGNPPAAVLGPGNSIRAALLRAARTQTEGTKAFGTW